MYAKPPFGGPRQVLKYLARYTHRVAIANQRLVAVSDGTVTFRWKDYAHGHRSRTMTLEAVEFLRRFLLHRLPRGFHHIRQYGLLGNRRRSAQLERCRALLGEPPGLLQRPDAESAADATPRDACPQCGTGRLVSVATLAPTARPIPWNTS